MAGFEIKNDGGVALRGSSSNIGLSVESAADVAARFDGALGPIELVPSGSAAAPSHSARAGILYLTSACVLYVCLGGSSWQKISAQ